MSKPMSEDWLNKTLTILCSKARLAMKSDAPFKYQVHAKDEAKQTILKELQAAERRGELRGRIDELERLYLVYGSKDKPASLDNLFSLGKGDEATTPIKLRLAELSKEEKQ